MMKTRTVIILSCLFSLSLFAGVSRAETAEEARIRQLQEQINQLEQQAAQYRGNIASERAKADSLNKEISILRNQIGQIEAQIASTDKKIELAQGEIDTVQQHIGETRETMRQKRDTLGRMVLALNRLDADSALVSFLKYANLSDFVQQFHDIASMQDSMLGLISDLRITKATLEDDRVALESEQTKLEQLSEEARQRRSQIAGVKGEKDRLLKVTKGQEATYQQQLTAVEKKKATFFKELRELELKVISGGLYIVHIKADTIPPKGTKIFQAPEENTHVTQGYGMTTYAKRGAYGGSPHNGVDFSAGFGSPIKAIGAGIIVANGTNSGWGNWVAIQHPNNMVSLYAHMSSLSPLKVGSSVTVGQIIGFEGSTGNSTGSHLHLSLYREFFTYIKESNGQLYFNYFDGSLDPRNYM